MAFEIRELGAEALELLAQIPIRFRVALGGVRAVFHKPHPQPQASKPAVRSVRRFLEASGVRP